MVHNTIQHDASIASPFVLKQDQTAPNRHCRTRRKDPPTRLGGLLIAGHGRLKLAAARLLAARRPLPNKNHRKVDEIRRTKKIKKNKKKKSLNRPGPFSLLGRANLYKQWRDVLAIQKRRVPEERMACWLCLVLVFVLVLSFGCLT